MESQTTLETIRRESQKIGVDFSDKAISQIETYFQELMRWNKKINLMGHKEESCTIANLFIDSLAFHKVFKQKTGSSILDVGSGAGFPGLPLKISCPDLFVTLVEPNLKKVSFLHHIVGLLKLKNVYVETSRIEDLNKSEEYKKIFDFIFLKALRFDACLPYVKPFLRKDGKLILSRPKKSQNLEDVPGFFVQEKISYLLPFDFGERVLLVLSPTN